MLRSFVFPARPSSSSVRLRCNSLPVIRSSARIQSQIESNVSCNTISPFLSRPCVQSSKLDLVPHHVCLKLEDASGCCIRYFDSTCGLCSRFYYYLAPYGLLTSRRRCRPRQRRPRQQGLCHCSSFRLTSRSSASSNSAYMS